MTGKVKRLPTVSDLELAIWMSVAMLLLAAIAVSCILADPPWQAGWFFGVVLAGVGIPTVDAWRDALRLKKRGC